MQAEAKERWMVLCEQAVKEKDPERFLQLIQEINQLLEAKAARMNATNSPQEP